MSPDLSLSLPQPLPPAGAAELQQALAASGARWVECAMADFGAVARGKVVSADDFVAMAGCRLPSVVLGLTLTAGEPEAIFGPLLPASYDDMRLLPDLQTLAPRPGRPAELSVICEPAGGLTLVHGVVRDASAYSPRAALRAVLARYAEAGLQARVAPELELFLLARGSDGALGAALPHPLSPTRERACEAFSLERLGHFNAYFDELYAACEQMRIPLNGHAHESAWSQYELNFRPGEPLAQADAVFRFKRLAREIAARHGHLASFAAKPFLGEPGTGMHWHVSLQRPADADWPHLFASPDGSDSPALLHFIAGLQRDAAAAMALFAPYDMAFDRIALSNASPSHASWGHEARSLAFRIPASSASSRRVENRLPGGDASPYLILAATLGLGMFGLQAGEAPLSGSGAGLALPTSLPEALDMLQASAALIGLIGRPLIDTFAAIKRHEHAERAALADPRADWDLTHLLELA